MGIEQNVGDEAADPADVRRALEAVLASTTFRGSVKLGAFLRFVVEATLRGEQDRIKGYTIGVEALGRPNDFDPQTDPIVRVEATRLRRRLERYNAAEGAADPITFTLARGSYVPVIRRNAPPPDAVAPAPSAAASRSNPALTRRWLVPAALAAIVMAAIGATALLLRGADRPGSGSAPRERAALGFDGPLQPGNGLPTLSVVPISFLGLPTTPGAMRPQVSFERPMTERLRSALARFDTVNVVGETGDAASAARPAADYQLIGSGELTVSGGAAIRFRLLDTAAATTIWSRNFDVAKVSTDYTAIEEQIARQLVQTLAPPFGVIRANERARQLSGAARDPRERCLLEASESFRSFDPAVHARARSCLETLTARDPAFALGLSYLGAVYTRQYQYGLGSEPGDPALLDRALRAVQRGIELAPESARAYQMLFTVLFARRDLAAAFAAGEKAIALNGLDTTIRSDYGGRLVMTGEIMRGLEALGRVADEGTVRPSWYRFYLFLGHYLQDDAAGASLHAAQVPLDSYPLGPLARTLAAILGGNPEQARAAFEGLASVRPAWRGHARAEILRIFPSPTADRMLRDLAAAGLAAPG